MDPLSPQSALDELADEFELLGEWEERYRHLIDLGRGLAPLSEAEHDEAHRVRGCASQVWLAVGRNAEGRLQLRGDSDAHIVKGLVAVVLRLYDGATPAQAAEFDAAAGFARLGLAGALSAQRANGLAAMVQRIRQDAATG